MQHRSVELVRVEWDSIYIILTYHYSKNQWEKKYYKKLNESSFILKDSTLVFLDNGTVNLPTISTKQGSKSSWNGVWLKYKMKFGLVCRKSKCEQGK